MGRPALYIKGERCPRGHALNAKNLRPRQRSTGQSGSYCLRCHSEWNKSRYLLRKQYLACLTQGG